MVEVVFLMPAPALAVDQRLPNASLPEDEGFEAGLLPPKEDVEEMPGRLPLPWLVAAVGTGAAVMVVK